MTLKKDKQKVLGETFDDMRVKEFLVVQTVGETDPNFTAMERAYRGMNEENFESFVKFFVADGRDINCTNADGDTLLQIISQHRHSSVYADALRAHGGK